MKKNQKIILSALFSCSTLVVGSTIVPTYINNNSTSNNNEVSLLSKTNQSASKTVQQTKTPVWWANSPFIDVDPITLGGSSSQGTAYMTAYIVDGHAYANDIPSDLINELSKSIINFATFEKFYNLINKDSMLHGKSRITEKNLNIQNLNRSETFNIKADIHKDIDNRISKIMITFSFKDSLYTWTDMYGNYPFVFNIFIDNDVLYDAEINKISSLEYHNPIILSKNEFSRYYVREALQKNISKITQNIHNYFKNYNKNVTYIENYSTLRFTEYGWVMDFKIVPNTLHGFKNDISNQWNNTCFSVLFKNVKYLPNNQTQPDVSNPIQRTDFEWDSFWRRFDLINTKTAYINGLENLRYNKYILIPYDKKPTEYIEKNIDSILNEVKAFYDNCGSKNVNFGYIENSLWQNKYGWTIRLYAIPQYGSTWYDGTRNQKEFTLLFEHFVIDMPSSFENEPLFERRDEEKNFLPPGNDNLSNNAYCPDIKTLKYDKWYFLYDMHYVTLTSAIYEDLGNIKQAMWTFLESKGAKNIDFYLQKDGIRLTSKGYVAYFSVIPKFKYSWSDGTRTQKEIMVLFENLKNTMKPPHVIVSNKMEEIDWIEYYKKK